MTDGNDGKEDLNSNSRSNTSLSRRSYLSAAIGLAGIGLGTDQLAAQSSDGQYETITVAENNQRTISIGDNESLENKLIDISAPGATFRIEAYGSDWAIRNVGVKGTWDVSSDGHEQAISCRVDSGTGVIENYYFADGVPDDTFPGVTGIYVQKRHAGTLQIRNVNIQEMPNNGIYASSPGDSGGGQGVVEVESSYFANNLASSVRLGTDGSYARNCVVNGGRHRGFWAYWRHATFENCSAVAGNPWDAGGASHDLQSTAVAELVNCSGEGSLRERGGGEIEGEMQGDPQTELPSGVPQSSEQAASGQSDFQNGGSDSTDTENETASTLRIETTESNPGMTYEFTVDGSITGGTSLEDSDTWSQSNGTTTASGEAGWGYSDAFTFDGAITDWNADEDQSMYTLLVDGEEVDPTQFTQSRDTETEDGDTDDTSTDTDEGDDQTDTSTGTEEPSEAERIVVIDGTEDPSSTSRYRVSVTGTLRKDSDRSTKNNGGIPWDDIEDNTQDGTVIGIVCNGIDAYRFTGTMTSIDIRGDASFTIVHT